MGYQYSTLQFVPDPARGERVNLGVIVGDDESGDWDVRLISGYRRAKAIDQEGHLASALDFVAGLEAEVVADTPQLRVSDLVRLSDEMRNIVQLSRPTPVVADSAIAALDMLFEELVVDPTAPAASQKKFRAVKETLRSYREHHIPDDALLRRPSARTDRYSTRFDFAIHNGDTVQLAQCWSFQVLGQDEIVDQVKSWAWTARELSQSGGRVFADSEDASFRIPDDVQIVAVYLPPMSGQNDAFAEARAAFEDANVLAFPVDQVDEVASMAAERLGAAV